MQIERWNADVDGPPSEAALRTRIEARGYRVSRYTYPPGTHFPEHTHAVDKIDAVLSGTFRLVIAGEEALLGPGDSVVVPGGVRHSATVMGDEPVVSLDAVRVSR
jgi:quercetin dioxygenase-like cupin family protein